MHSLLIHICTDICIFDSSLHSTVGEDLPLYFLSSSKRVTRCFQVLHENDAKTLTSARIKRVRSDRFVNQTHAITIQFSSHTTRRIGSLIKLA